MANPHADRFHAGERIRMFDYLAQYEELKGEIDTAIRRVLGSGQLILGPEGQQFEKEFAAFLGGGGTCVGVNSGTDALIIALRALGVGAEDEVVTVANTAVPTVSAIRAVGARPVFCDVDERTGLMDLSKLPQALGARCRAIVPVHLYGNVVDVPRIREIAGTRPIRILEDCAQAHGALLRGQPAGTFGDAAAFSFYPTKNLGAYGDGGLCYSRDAELVRQIKMIRMYGFDGRYYAEREGINSRLDELQATILRVKLRRLAGWIDRRRALAAAYDRLLPQSVGRTTAGAGVLHSYHLYVVKVPDRDRVREELTRRGVETGIHYPYPIHRMRAYAFLGYREGSLPCTENLAQRILSLPLYPELSMESVERVCAELTSVLS